MDRQATAVQRRRPFAAAVAIATLVVTIVAGCGGGDESPKAPQPLDAYAGKAEGSDAYIGLITDGDRLAGYITDGKAISIWLAVAEIDDDEATLASREGQVLGKASISGDSASGEFQVGPKSFTFDAPKATGEAGLYQAAGRKQNDDSFQAGWVVLADGSQRGGLDTFINGTVTNHPAPTLAATVNIPGFGPFVAAELTTAYLDNLVKAPE
jgi:hypothetical protein